MAHCREKDIVLMAHCREILSSWHTVERYCPHSTLQRERCPDATVDRYFHIPLKGDGYYRDATVERKMLSSWHTRKNIVLIPLQRDGYCPRGMLRKQYCPVTLQRDGYYLDTNVERYCPHGMLQRERCCPNNTVEIWILS